MHAVEMPHGHALQFVLHTTCCDTDLDRSKPKVVVKENSDCFKGTLKCHIKKEHGRKGKVLHLLCFHRVQVKLHPLKVTWCICTLSTDTGGAEREDC